MSEYRHRHVYVADWFDRVACVMRRFFLFFYPVDSSVQLYDTQSRRLFLKRTKCTGISLKDLYIGSVVNVFSRILKIVDYADNVTKTSTENRIQKFCALILPHAIPKLGEILVKIFSKQYQLTNMRSMCLLRREAYDILNGYDCDIMAKVSQMTSGPVVAIELIGEFALLRWNELLGPDDSEVARNIAPNSIRALYGVDVIKNAIFCNLDRAENMKNSDIIFPKHENQRLKPKNSSILLKCSCCVIKPHAVSSGHVADIVEDIQKAGFRIQAIERFYVDATCAEEFYAVYRNLTTEFEAMVIELQSGACIAMEIILEDSSRDVVTEFREFCGPEDPDVARRLRPGSLRAKYGVTKILNAIHCSNLPEDGVLETEYFFELLDEEI